MVTEVEGKSAAAVDRMVVAQADQLAAVLGQKLVVEWDQMAAESDRKAAESGQMGAVLGQRAVAGAHLGADHSQVSQGSSLGLRGLRERLEE